MRQDGRLPGAIRSVNIKTGYIKYAEGSCLFEIGNTKVICTATVEEGVPVFLKGSGTGWVTSEYGMLPRSCQRRIPRESSKGKKGGRTLEIQRLIGRALRSVVNLEILGERTIWLDCDVIQADGGTRCASITGSFIALCEAVNYLTKERLIRESPIINFAAAISVGIVGGEILLDLNYDEDSSAEVDMNIVMTDSGKFVEVQGTAEKDPFDENELSGMMKMARKGIEKLIEKQKKALEGMVA